MHKFPNQLEQRDGMYFDWWKKVIKKKAAADWGIESKIEELPMLLVQP